MSSFAKPASSSNFTSFWTITAWPLFEMEKLLKRRCCRDLEGQNVIPDSHHSWSEGLCDTEHGCQYDDSISHAVSVLQTSSGKPLFVKSLSKTDGKGSSVYWPEVDSSPLIESLYEDKTARFAKDRKLPRRANAPTTIPKTDIPHYTEFIFLINSLLQRKCLRSYCENLLTYM